MKRLYKYISILLLGIFIFTLSSCNNYNSNNSNPSASSESRTAIYSATEQEVNTSKKYYLKGYNEQDYYQWKSYNEIMWTKGSSQYILNITRVDSCHFAVGRNIYYFSDNLIYQFGNESNYYSAVRLD